MVGTNESGSRQRKLANWIDSFLEQTAVLPSPELFRRWTAISLVSSVLERKVWARTRGAQLFPNQYIILVGPPGVGKSVVLSQAERMLRAITDLHVAPSSVTTASLADAMTLAARKIIRPTQTPNFIQFNSLQVIASELGVFLPAYDSSYVNLLTKMYDGELYEERRRTGRVTHMKIDQTLLSILGGTTPSFLNAHLPEGAWDQGFTSRTIFVFAGVPIRTTIFGEYEDLTKQTKAYTDLLYDLQLIAELYGEVQWTKEAQDAIVEWDMKELDPIPGHGKLLHYNTRRLAHCLKLAITVSVSRSSDLQVSLEDFLLARDWLLEAEVFMPDIFKSMGSTSDAKAMDDCWYFVFEQYSKSKRPVSESVIFDFLRKRVATHQVSRTIDVMIRSNMLRLEFTSDGRAAYVPIAKH